MTRRVVLVVDLQNDYFPGGKLPLSNVEAARDQAARVIAAARADGAPVIHIRHEFADANAPFFAPGSFGAQIQAAVRPAEGETVVLKHHANSFRDTPLKTVLDSHSPDEVVIVGAMSHMCIDATARAAADLGYKTIVLHDACATLDLSFGGQSVPASQVQAAFMAALASGYAQVLSVEEHIGG